jgi:hypothetical protein
MLPALWPGDIVEIATCSPQDLRPGEIVLALREGQFFLHRLVSPPTSDSFTLCGDSMIAADPVFVSENLLGRLVGAEVGRFCSIALRPGAGAKCSRAIGIILCHSAVAKRIALRFGGRAGTQGTPREAKFHTMNTA